MIKDENIYCLEEAGVFPFGDETRGLLLEVARKIIRGTVGSDDKPVTTRAKHLSEFDNVLDGVVMTDYKRIVEKGHTGLLFEAHIGPVQNPTHIILFMVKSDYQGIPPEPPQARKRLVEQDAEEEAVPA